MYNTPIKDSKTQGQTVGRYVDVLNRRDDQASIRQQIINLLEAEGFDVAAWGMDESPTTRSRWYDENLIKNIASPYSETSPGPELVTNGDFSDGTNDWTNSGASPTFEVVTYQGSDQMHIVADGGNQGIRQSIAGMTTGNTYLVTVNLTVLSGSALILVSGDTDSGLATGTHTRLFVKTSASNNFVYVRSFGDPAEFYVDSVSIKQVSGLDINTTDVAFNQAIYRPLEGAELITDGGFTGTQNWVSDDPTDGWRTSYQDAFVDGSQSSTTTLTNSATLTANKLYKVAGNVSAYTAGTLTINVGDGSVDITASGEFLEYVYSGSGTTFSLEADATGDFTVDSCYAVEAGADVITNGDMSSESGWILGDDTEFVGGKAVLTETSSTQMRQTGVMTEGNTYFVSLDIDSITEGGLQIRTGVGGIVATVSNPGSYEYVSECVGDGTFYIICVGGSTTAVVDNVRVIPINTLLSYPFFGADSGWTKGSGVTISGGELVMAAATTGTFQNAGIVAGRDYLLKYDLGSYSAGTFNFLVGSSAGSTGRTANGTYTEIVTAAGNSFLYPNGVVSFTGNIDNIYLEDLTNNVLNDPTFDEPVVNWTISGNAEVIQVEDGVLHIDADDSADGILQVIQAEIGDTLKMTANVTVASGTAEFLVFESGTIHSELVTSTGAVTAVLANTSSATNLNIYIRSSGGAADFTVDDFSIVEIPNNVVEDPGFDNGLSDWSTDGAEWSDGGGYAACDGSQVSTTRLRQVNALSEMDDGQLCYVQFEISNYSAGGVRIKIGDTVSPNDFESGNGIYTVTIAKGATNDHIELQANSTFVGGIDNVIVAPVVDSGVRGALWNGATSEGIIAANAAFANPAFTWLFFTFPYSQGENTFGRFYIHDGIPSWLLMNGSDNLRSDVDTDSTSALAIADANSYSALFNTPHMVVQHYDDNGDRLNYLKYGTGTGNVTQLAGTPDVAATGTLTDVSGADVYIGNNDTTLYTFDGLFFFIIYVDDVVSDTLLDEIDTLMGNALGVT